MRLVFAVLLLTATATAAQAAPFQDLDAMERQVIVTAGAGIGEAGGPIAPIDRRLKLADCPGFSVDPPYAGAVVVRCPAIGWRLRVALRSAGQQDAAAPAARIVRQAPVIRRGDPVSLVAETGAFSVSSEVVAEQDGAPGDRIRVRADAKTQPVMAEVIEAGKVRVAAFK